MILIVQVFCNMKEKKSTKKILGVNLPACSTDFQLENLFLNHTIIFVCVNISFVH